MTPSSRIRIDILVHQRGLVRSRAAARDAVLRGGVSVDGTTVTKPGALVPSDCELQVGALEGRYVSRAALKLLAALDAFSFDAAGQIALDVGASTGGFTQVLLERGAAKVYAVDVGRGQLDTALAGDERVVALEQTDARQLSRAIIAEPVTAIVSDVSFISLTKALPAALLLAAPGAWLVALIKPQFEVGRDGVGRGGIVRDDAIRHAAVARLRHWMAGQPGWRVADIIASPIKGSDGNVEFLLGAKFRGIDP